MLSTTQVGLRLCKYLLDGMVTLYDAEEISDGGKAFDVGYSIFTRVIEDGLAPTLYICLSVNEEPVVPHQTTLLKLIDSYLQSISCGVTSDIHVGLAPLMTEVFFQLASYSTEGIRKALGFSEEEDTPAYVDTAETGSNPGTKSVPLELDPIIPRVCEALVLVTQCLVTITLEDEPEGDGSPHTKSSEGTSSESEGGAQRNESTNGEPVNGGQLEAARIGDLKRMINEVKSKEGDGVVETLIKLLRVLDVFLPRINFGAPVLSSSANPENQTPPPSSPINTHVPSGFSYLKRDLVRLLGILCHANASVQDRIRVSGGIPVVMGLCIIDERNPYLREHAIFALRNLLDQNAENQAVVQAMTPLNEALTGIANNEVPVSKFEESA